jgi:hypothetical protein
VSTLRICGLSALLFGAVFLTSAVVSWLISGDPFYGESAGIGAVFAGMAAWQLHKDNKSKING